MSDQDTESRKVTISGTNLAPTEMESLDKAMIYAEWIADTTIIWKAKGDDWIDVTSDQGFVIHDPLRSNEDEH